MADMDMHQLALMRAPFAVVITNPHLADNPIVFVNRAFTRLTGYSEAGIIGRNCRFLQGPDTDADAIDQIRAAVARREDLSVELLNYRADGTPFLNRVHVSPLFSNDGELEFYLGLQTAVGSRASLIGAGVDDALREIHHRVKNHLSMVVGMIRMQARVENASSVDNYTTLARRIETLQYLYEEMMNFNGTEGEETIALGAYVSRIASAISYLDGRQSIRLNVDLDNVRAPVDVAAQIGLLVSEILTNAYKHAFDATSDGFIEVSLRELSDRTVRIRISDDGRGLPPGSRWPENSGLGGRIVRSLLTGLDGQLDVSSHQRGATFTVDLDPKLFLAPAPREADATNGAGPPPQTSHTAGDGAEERRGG